LPLFHFDCEHFLQTLFRCLRHRWYSPLITRYIIVCHIIFALFHIAIYYYYFR
jgi:hypothetical protein